MAYLIDSDIMLDFTRGAAEAVDYLQSLGRACRISSDTALEEGRDEKEKTLRGAATTAATRRK